MEHPSREELEAYLARGLKSHEIAEAIEADSGQPIAPGTVRRMLSEAGLSAKHYGPEQYYVPEEWRPIRAKHRGRRDLQRLRQLGYRREGMPLNDDPEKAAVQERQLDRWVSELEAANAVIRYYPNTHKGFYWFVRTEGDAEYTSTRTDVPDSTQSASTG